MRERLAYHRRRLRIVGRKRAAGLPLDIRFTDATGVPCRITGWTRGDTRSPDWVPVLECDVLIPSQPGPIFNIVAEPPGVLRTHVDYDDMRLEVSVDHYRPGKPPDLSWYELEDDGGGPLYRTLDWP